MDTINQTLLFGKASWCMGLAYYKHIDNSREFAMKIYYHDDEQYYISVRWESIPGGEFAGISRVF